MQNLSTKSFHAVCLILFTGFFSSSFSQVVIRDTVTITPKNISLKPLSVVATSPVVDVSFTVVGDALIPGMTIWVQMPDRIWTLFDNPCPGNVPKITEGPDMGIFPEDGSYIGNVIVGDCYGDFGDSLTYTPYVSPDYGSSTQVAVNWIGVGSTARFIGYFTYEKPPLPTIQLQHGNFYISQEVHPVIQLTPEYSPMPGEKYSAVLTCSPSAVINTADYVPQVLAQGYAPFFFTATATNLSGFATDTTTMMLLGLHHFALTPNPQNVEHGQTVNFYAEAEDIYNNVIDNFYGAQYSTDYPYDIPLTVSWSPDTLGEVIIPSGGASVAARSTDPLSKGTREQKLQPLEKSSAIGQKNNPIKILNNLISKTGAVNFPKNSDFSKSGTKKVKSLTQTATSSTALISMRKVWSSWLMENCRLFQTQ